jgi:carbonic anhydrase/acetyltransferase-like protein (isoleucine patch superfamily)
MPDIIDEMLDKGLLVLEKIPKPKKHRFHTSDGGRLRVEAHRHPNGGGWVANTAKVDPAVYVSASSEVFDKAEIRGHVIIKGRCRVFGHAKIDGNVTLLGDVTVGENVRIFDSATISGRIDIKNNVGIYGVSSVCGEVILSNNVTIHGSQISGWGTIRDAATITSSTITGDFCICNHASINASTFIGRFFIGGTTAVSTSRMTTHVSHSNFYRKRLRKVSYGPPSADLNHVDLPADTNHISVHVDIATSGTMILRGRTTIAGSDIRTPLHCAHSIALNRVTVQYFNSRAFVVTRSLSLTESNVSSVELRNIFNNQNDNNRNSRPNVSMGGQNNNNQNSAASANTATPVPVFDPRGSRIIRV